MANRNNSVEYCRQIEGIVNSRFIDTIRNEYGYLFELLPISTNPDTDIQRVLSERVGEYQAQKHIRIKRAFMMEHEVVLLSRFFTEQILDRKVEDNQDVLEELLDQINPNDNVGNAVFAGAGVAHLIQHNADFDGDNIAPVQLQNNEDVVMQNEQDGQDEQIELIEQAANAGIIVDEELPVLEDDIIDQIENADLNVDLEQPLDNIQPAGNIGNVDIDDDSDSDNDDLSSDGDDDGDDGDDGNVALPVANQPVDLEQPMDNDPPIDPLNINGVDYAYLQRVRDTLRGGIHTPEDLQVIVGFKDYVRQLLLGIGGANVNSENNLGGNVGHLPTTDATAVLENADNNSANAAANTNENNNANTIIADIVELSRMELEINYSDNIPVNIEFPKEPVDDGILNWAGPNISNYSVERYRSATHTVSIEAILIAPGVYSLHGVEIGMKSLIKLLMFLSPSFAYNLTHAKFKDTPLRVDLSPQLITAFTPTFSEFYGSHMFADCTLLVSGYKFYAHKIILAAESDVFKNYYQGDWGRRNNLEEPFVIEADAILFGKILDFIYTRKITCANTAEVVDLYSVADAYGFKKLLQALDTHINPIIGVAIRKRLYQNHPRPRVNDTVETIVSKQLEPLIVNENSLMEEVD